MCSRCILPRPIDDGHETVEELSPKYDAYQTMLTNIMTVSALMLGFVMTGTMLSVGLTGYDNYDNFKILQFLKNSSLAAFFAGVTMLTAFVVSVKTTQRYTNYGVKNALRHVRRSTLPILMAELCLYLSVIYFLMSVENFIKANYMGPDICPIDSTGEFFRPGAQCSMLGEDMFETAQEFCTHYNNTKFSKWPMCQYYEKFTRPENANDSYYAATHYVGHAYFGWQVDDSEDGFQSAERLGVVSNVTNKFCLQSVADENMDSLCREAWKHPEARTPCSTSIMAHATADNCQRANEDKADACYKVCAWRDDPANGDDIRPRQEISKIVRYLFRPLYFLIDVLITWRLLFGLRQVWAICAHDLAAGQSPCDVFRMHVAPVSDDDTESEAEDDSGPDSSDKVYA